MRPTTAGLLARSERKPACEQHDCIMMLASASARVENGCTPGFQRAIFSMHEIDKVED